MRLGGAPPGAGGKLSLRFWCSLNSVSAALSPQIAVSRWPDSNYVPPMLALSTVCPDTHMR